MSESGLAKVMMAGAYQRAFSHSALEVGTLQKETGPGYHPGVLQEDISPDCRPSSSADWRCSEEPCVHVSGET